MNILWEALLEKQGGWRGAAVAKVALSIIW